MRIIAIVVVCTALSSAAPPAWAEAAALPGSHPLSQAEAGDVLIADLRCAACHAGVASDPALATSAPDLSSVGSRVVPGYLRRFLASPSSVHPGTTMPDMLASRPEAEREAIAEALTHFLVSVARDPWPADPERAASGPLGKDLFHSVGCVACHGPQEPLETMPADEESDEDDEPVPAAPRAAPIAIPLGHVAGKYRTGSLGQFLFQPLRVRASGRMPDMKLTPAESAAIAAYLVGDRETASEPLTPNPSLVATGEKLFRELNCAACHTLPGIEPAPRVLPLSSATPARGCLSAASGSGPRFHLAEPQISAIDAALRAPKRREPAAATIAKSLTAFRCIACHVRDDYGGVPDAYNPFFTGSEHNLGDDGRIPPPLTLVGAKLRPEWMKKVLFDGESVRPYMATRMPQYGAANLGHLPSLLGSTDVVTSPAMTLPPAENRSPAEQDLEKQLRAAGRELLGDKGLNCIACHRFNGKPAIANQGIDLMTTSPRLQPGWFNRYLRSPGEFRPRTVMPSAWPNGVSIHKTILDGDADRQIAAIWYYLSLGRSAADPPGIRPLNTRLTVGDRVELHRGRSRVAGYRGIAVGLPARVSYAFNAETGSVAAIWHGDFITVNWSGQGSGDFQPCEPAITLPQDVSFARLADDQAQWPKAPLMSKEARINPDPLYPRNVGYRFRGYDLERSGNPTFRYRVGSVDVSDRSVATAGADGTPPRLTRTLVLHSAAREQLWFRPLTGDIDRGSDRVFRHGSLRLTIPPGDVRLRPLAGSGGSELLLDLDVPEGESSLEFTYELLPN
jgi:mono/diheme cytochrome c family protein